MKVGISGHQDLGPVEKITWVREELRSQLDCRSFSSGVSSLAAGADQLFARVVLELGHNIEVVIPCGQYESAFEDADAVQTFRWLKAKAARSYLLEFPAPSEEAFFAAGRRVVEISDLLFAVWDGKAAAGAGGTADVVKYALKHRRQVLHINPIAKTTRLLEDR
jgi:hypothetical protein